jgi:CheY-like chemotaxis protein
MGIPEEEKPFVFDRFYRSTKAQLNAIRGNGLGLSIAKGLIELLGGSLSLESVDGKGSTFVCSIRYEQPPAHTELVSKPVPAKEISDFKKLSVLIVEDEKDNANMLVSMLQPMVGRLDVAENGLVALEKLNKQSYNLVLMDIKMPLMNGIETVKEIRKSDKNLSIIAQTAYATEDELKAALQAGYNDYLIKPLSLKKVLEVIRRYCID